MTDVQMLKFEQSERCRNVLLSTNDSTNLVYHEGRDKLWGDGGVEGTGSNMLGLFLLFILLLLFSIFDLNKKIGIILMKIRNVLRFKYNVESSYVVPPPKVKTPRRLSDKKLQKRTNHFDKVHYFRNLKKVTTNANMTQLGGNNLVFNPLGYQFQQQQQFQQPLLQVQQTSFDYQQQQAFLYQQQLQQQYLQSFSQQPQTLLKQQQPQFTTEQQTLEYKQQWIASWINSVPENAREIIKSIAFNSPQIWNFLTSTQQIW